MATTETRPRGGVPFREVREAVTGPQSAEAAGLEPARERRKFACPCGKSSDALHVYADGSYCFSCARHFSVVDLYAEASRCEPSEACLALADRFGIRPDPRHQSLGRPSRPRPRSSAPAPLDPDVLRARAEVYGGLLERQTLGPAGRDYLAGRGLDPDLAELVGLRSLENAEEWTELQAELWNRHDPEDLVAAGFASRPNDGGPPRRWLPWSGEVSALLLPYRAATGQVEAVRFRRMTPGSRRYMSLRGAGSRVPFLAETLEAPHPLELVVTEGELDALALHQAGWAAIGLGGATPSRALLRAVVSGLEDAEAVALWTDSDEAGEGAVERLAAMLSERYGDMWVVRRVRRWRSKVDAADLAAAGELA